MGRNLSWKEVSKAKYVAWSKTFISIAFIGIESSSSMGTICIVPTLYVIRLWGNNMGELCFKLLLWQMQKQKQK